MLMALNEEYFTELSESDYGCLLRLPSAQFVKAVRSRWPTWELLPAQLQGRPQGTPAFPDKKDLQRRWRKTRGARAYARGAQQVDPEGHQIEGWPEYNGGILNPQPEDLRLGQRYFRFVDSRKPAAVQKAGAWWLDWPSVKLLAHFAREHSSPREAVQYFCAVYFGNSRCDKLVTGYLAMPLKAYAGKGREFRVAGERFIPPQHLEVKQLCIPGLFEPYGAQKSCAEKAMTLLPVVDIWSSDVFKGQ